jgi:2-(1,2-epoxy-1,2-dihydrophenyl)acetyl-CoA isomerase
MDFSTVIYNTAEHIATLTLNRPEKLNAISPVMTQEIIRVLNEVDSDDDVRVLIITGAGKAFCAGADVGTLPGDAKNQAPVTGETTRTAEDIRRGLVASSGVILPKLQRLQKPTIAMVNGVAVGAGCDLAMGCDLRTGSENTRFMNAFIRIGLFPGWGGTWLYPRIMGLGKALEFLFTGDYLEAQEAEKVGVLNKLTKADELTSTTMTLAQKIANGPPIAMRLTKMQVYKGLEVDLETALQMAAACETITLTSEDHKEGVKALREKRRPEFKGK